MRAGGAGLRAGAAVAASTIAPRALGAHSGRTSHCPTPECRRADTAGSGSAQSSVHEAVDTTAPSFRSGPATHTRRIAQARTQEDIMSRIRTVVVIFDAGIPR
jgi:hypothetical protein